jgi:hypothetical protein
MRPKPRVADRPALAQGVSAIVALLGWETLRGDTDVHHRLADPSIPAIANAWVMPTLPALAWLATFTPHG